MSKREYIGGPEHMRQLAIKQIQDAANDESPMNCINFNQAERAYYVCKGDPELAHRFLTEFIPDMALMEMQMEVDRRFVKRIIEEVIFENQVREANRRRAEDDAYTKILVQEFYEARQLAKVLKFGDHATFGPFPKEENND